MKNRSQETSGSLRAVKLIQYFFWILAPPYTTWSGCRDGAWPSGSSDTDGSQTLELVVLERTTQHHKTDSSDLVLALSPSNY